MSRTPTDSRALPAAIALSFSLLLAASALAAQTFQLSGKVIYVDDGDTLILLQKDRVKVNVRLSDIDAPDVSHGGGRPEQPFSQASKQSLARMARGVTAQATCYERSVCTVFVNGVGVNAEQVRRGMAWANHASSRYVRNPQTYACEKLAQSSALGLWAGKGQTAPDFPLGVVTTVLEIQSLRRRR